MRGVFIVLEGLDGSGKSTQVKLLAERINETGVEAVLLKEPTDGPWGRRIREIAANGRGAVSLEEELSWFINDRRDDVETNIKPAIESGKVVVMDRYIHSNMAYQGALGIDVKTIVEMNRMFPRPDLVIFLDITPSQGLKRVGGRGGANVGYEKAEFLEKVCALYSGPAFSDMVRVDASGSVEDVARTIWGHVKAILPAEKG